MRTCGRKTAIAESCEGHPDGKSPTHGSAPPTAYSSRNGIWDMTNGLKSHMAPVIGRRWRPICGFAEPHASVPGRDPGNSSGNRRRSSPAPRKAVQCCGSAGPGWLQLTVLAGCHFNARSRPPVSAVAGPSERARRRTPESTPIRCLLNVKAATLRHASTSPMHTAPAGSPATPRLPGFVEVLHLAPAGRHADGVDFASVRCWGGLTLTTALREGSFFSSF